MFCRWCSRTTLLFLLAVLLLPGCGRKTALVVPQVLVPVAIVDLRPTLDENGATLEWTYPAEMENGDPLSAIENFEVLQAAVPEADYCEGCPVRFEQKGLVDGGLLPVTGESRTATYRETGLQDGYRYLYKVRSRAGRLYASRDSNIVSFVWMTPPESPDGLEIAAGDRELILKWDAVKVNIAGNSLASPPVYQVYRRRRGDEEFFALGEPLQGPEFIDAGLNNGELYHYKVRTLVASAEALQPGGFSKEISAVPRDIKPPAVPRNLVAIEIPAGVKLAWQAVLNEDLAGYRVYRRKEGAEQPELIAEVKSSQNQFVDHDVPAGAKWYYSVTSFDRMQPPNESLLSEESVMDLQ